MLTGKCIEAFEKWLDKQNFSISHDVGDRQMNVVPLGDMFSQLPLSMQFGVYVDFFDSVGLNILLTVEFDYGYIITEDKYQEIEEVKKFYETRQEAREQSILKANSIYNESNE